MALDRIHLRKILKIMFQDVNAQHSEIRKDIREEIRRESGLDGSGGDFYAPFWSDARQHIFGNAHLSELVDGRIAMNDRRAHLYPRLRDGFLLWWNERRRWTNEPFQPGRTLKCLFPFPGLDATIKVDSIISVRDGRGQEHAVYPYFSPQPVLSDEAARLGLWLLARALPNIDEHEIRILDVIRGTTFSLDRTPLLGNEEQSFRQRYGDILSARAALRALY